jgi:hypothetical protein
MSVRPASGTTREWALVGLAWLAIVVCAAVWTAIDTRPPEWDHANHLERAVTCAQDLGKGDWRTILQRSSFYPPIVPCAAGLLYRLLPTDAAAAEAVMLLFLGAGMAATYALGRALAGGTAGVAAAWIFGTAPFVIFSALRFQLDLPLAVLVATALLVLIRTDGFTHVGWSLVAGLVFGVGMLTKPPFAAYVLPPVLWMLVRERHRRAFANAALAALVAAVVAGAWYGPRMVGMPRQIALRAVTHGAEEGKPPTLTSEALTFYPSTLPTELGLLATVLLLAGLVVALLRRQGMVVVAFVVPFALFMLLRNKDMRYILPLLPVAAALGGLVVGALSSRLGSVALAVLALVGVVQVSAVAWAVPPPLELPWRRMPWVLESAPVRDDWRQRDLLRMIVQDRAGQPATVSIVPNYRFFSVSNFRYYAVRDALPLRFVRARPGEPLDIDYMILKTGNQGPDFSVGKTLQVIDRLARDPALARAYPVIADLPLPDGSTATLRARRLTQPVDVPADVLAQRLEAAMRERIGEVARDVDGLEIRVVHDGEIARGRVRRLEASARAAAVGELTRRDAATLRVQNLRLVAEDVLVNPYALEGGRLQLFDVGRLRLERMQVGAGDLQAFLSALRAFRGSRVRLGSGWMDLVLEQPGPDVAARVRFVPVAGRPFGVAVDRASLGWIPLPRLLVDWVVRNYDPTPQIAARLDFPVELGHVSVSEQAIRLGD